MPLLNNNPAARLHTFLVRGLEVEKNSHVKDALRLVFNDLRATDVEILHRLAPILRLPLESVEAIHGLGPRINQELCLRWVPGVEQAFSQLNFVQTWDGFRSATNQVTLFALEMAADQLARYAPEFTDEDTLQQIREQVNDLAADITLAKLDPDLQTFLLSTLAAMRNAIDDYPFSGPTGVRDVVSTTIINITVNPEVKTKLASSTFGQRFWAVVKGLLLLTNVLHNVGLLPLDFAPLELPPIQDIDLGSAPSGPTDPADPVQV